MKFSVYSRRWGHNDTYDIEKTTTGWHISHGPMGGDTDKTASPALLNLLDHDSINYPEELPGYFEFLWEESDTWTEQQIQDELNVLAEWVNIVEKNSPGNFFSTYK